jgi:hypothetical protein
MPIGILFWLIFVIYVLFGFYWVLPGRTPAQPGQPGQPIAVYGGVGNHLLLLILIFLLGWAQFGFVVK